MTILNSYGYIKGELISLNSKISKKEPQGDVNVYLPVSKESDIDTSIALADKLNLTNRLDFSESYDFYSDYQYLKIYKEINRLMYKEKPIKTTKVINNSEEAQSYAYEFIAPFICLLNYDYIQKSFDQGIYSICFVKKQDNIDVKSPESIIKLDIYGNIIVFDCYYFDYKKIDSVPIKAKKEIIKEIINELDNAYILEDQLIYSYLNSIIQPFYSFKFASRDNKVFEYLVPAAKYIITILFF
jgi:hypothetical protein